MKRVSIFHNYNFLKLMFYYDDERFIITTKYKLIMSDKMISLEMER